MNSHKDDQLWSIAREKVNSRQKVRYRHSMYVFFVVNLVAWLAWFSITVVNHSWQPLWPLFLVIIWFFRIPVSRIVTRTLEPNNEIFQEYTKLKIAKEDAFNFLKKDKS
ncbi:hypothetical protein H0X06_04010 [Candidatus Dependentiae bacterium]|nr:hypothetical protein [Candidatus Dependentiae bacterium]